VKRDDQPDPITSETNVHGAGRVTSIAQARRQARQRRTNSLTESERQLLLAEVAKISAELCKLQVWAAEITQRAVRPADDRAGRTA
jgi:hypothetical protein